MDILKKKRVKTLTIIKRVNEINRLKNIEVQLSIAKQLGVNQS